VNDRETADSMSTAALRKIYRDLLVKPFSESSKSESDAWLMAFDTDLENYVNCRIHQRLVEMGVDSGCDCNYKEVANG